MSHPRMSEDEKELTAAAREKEKHEGTGQDFLKSVKRVVVRTWQTLTMTPSMNFIAKRWAALVQLYNGGMKAFW